MAHRAPRQLGPDRLRFEGERAIVESPREMPDWRASRFRRTEVRLEGERFFVAAVERVGRGYRYRLELWPADLTDRPSHALDYDAAYVEARDAGRERAFLALALWPLVVVAMPLLGLLWHRSKRRLAGLLGLDPGRATRVSLLVQYVTVLVLGVLTWALTLAPEYAPVTWRQTLITALVLLVDAAYRWDHAMDAPEEHLGLFEWLRTRVFA